MAAYFFYMLSNSFSKVSSFVSNFLFSLISLATFIPYQATLIPLTKLIADMGLLNTYWGGLAFAFFIFYMPTGGALLMSIFITAIPPRIIEAARLDRGGSDWRIFSRLVFPLSLPGFISTLIFNIIETWNNFFIPLMLTTTPDMRLIPVTVQSFTGGYATLYNETFAAAFIASMVPLGIFIFLGRYFIRGLIALGTGGKGGFDMVNVVAKGITKIYKSRKKEVVALDNVSIDIRSGESFGILGPSGAGKTTFMRIIAGLDIPPGENCISMMN